MAAIHFERIQPLTLKLQRLKIVTNTELGGAPVFVNPDGKHIILKEFLLTVGTQRNSLYILPLFGEKQVWTNVEVVTAK